jgi:cytochrome P450
MLASLAFLVSTLGALRVVGTTVLLFITGSHLAHNCWGYKSLLRYLPFTCASEKMSVLTDFNLSNNRLSSSTAFTLSKDGDIETFQVCVGLIAICKRLETLRSHVLKALLLYVAGPPARWLIGGLPEVKAMSMHEAYDMWAQKYAEHGVFKVFLGGALHVVVVDPALVTKMLTSSPDRFNPLVPTSELDRLWLENQMLFLNGSAWKERRASFNQFLINPAKLEAYFPLMLRSIDRLADHLATIADSSAAVDIWPLFGRLTLDVILTIASGLEINTLDEIIVSDRKISGKVEDSLGDTLVRTLRADINSFTYEAGMAVLLLFPGLRWLAEFVNRHALSENGKKGAAARREMKDIFFSLVDAARQSPPSDHNDSNVGINPESFLAAVASVKDADTGELKPKMWPAIQTYLFTIAGYETTANTLAYTVHLLAQNPDKQERLIAEVDTFGRNRTPTFADLEQLPYLHACLMESLRLYPAGALTVRLSKTDMMLGPYHVPKGTRMHSVSWSTHRMPQYWERSLEFLPERWLDDTKGVPSADSKAHLPFGGGARKCPGSRLALQEAQLALLRLYQRFKFDMPRCSSALKLRLDITLTPKESGVPALIIAR